MTSYLTIQTTTDARPRRVLPQDFARLFAEEAITSPDTRVERLANATIGLLVPLRALLLAARAQTARRRRMSPRLRVRPVNA